MKLALTIILVLFSMSPVSFFPAQAQSSDDPKVIFSVAPVYPLIAHIARVDGDCIVEVRIDRNGTVKSAQMIEGQPIFRQRVIDAASGWRFSPGSPTSGLRVAHLTFNFKEGPRGEKEQDYVDSVFVPPYRMELTYRQAKVPEVILLPREDGKIKVEECQLHHQMMEVDIVPIAYGLPNFDSEDYKEYEKAEEELFPNSNFTSFGGCVDYGTKKEEVLYCLKCREAESKWRKKHHLPQPVMKVTMP